MRRRLPRATVRSSDGTWDTKHGTPIRIEKEAGIIVWGRPFDVLEAFQFLFVFVFSNTYHAGLKVGFRFVKLVDQSNEFCIALFALDLKPRGI